MGSEGVLDDWLGTWEGTWSTWLEPGVLHDQSPITMEVTPADDGWLLAYRGAIAGDPVSGSIVAARGLGELRWTDTWHTGGTEERLTSDGAGPASYAYGPEDAPWRWAISIDVERTRMVITHTNTPPGGDPAEAVRMVLSR